MAEIRTERLLLRRARAADLADLHKVLSHPRAMRFWSTLPHGTIEKTREWLERMISAPASESEDFVIELGGRVIGKAGCWRLPEIGFILHPDHWGRGYAREALAAVIGHIFDRSAIPAITADVDPRNRPSLTLLQELGFVETATAERTYRIADEWCDSVYLALTRQGASLSRPSHNPPFRERRGQP